MVIQKVSKANRFGQARAREIAAGMEAEIDALLKEAKTAQKTLQQSGLEPWAEKPGVSTDLKNKNWKILSLRWCFLCSHCS